ncbi:MULTISPECIES: SDR family NAD(P)-dependent oxidoreductase [unclassified Actinotalea]|uniref:SDR family NAD(P)-dependent oxidoreductase n=1 Tax=unclassified Actinotalea TaxID=2638618 RepID=UPI0015F49365|nr:MULTISPECIES: SDR family NAD(P)-dependent oxidoreductase [unclassified Actinotalea]
MSVARDAGAHPVPVGVDLRGTTALVTGGTGGMGRVLVTALAGAGADVVTVTRDPARGRELVARVARDVGGDRVQVLTADLSSRADLHAVAERVRSERPELHLVVHNAGAHFPDHALTVDGVERHVALDHLAGFTLTTLLEDRLRAGARVVTVVSAAMNDTRRVRIGGRPRPVRLEPAQLDDVRLLNPAAGFVPFEAYARAKLLATMCGYEHAGRLAASGVTVNAVHPGIVGTPLVDAMVPGPLRALRPLLRRALLTPEAGAASVLRLATDPAVTGTGHYYERAARAESPPASHDARLRAMAWEASRAWAFGR